MKIGTKEEIYKPLYELADDRISNVIRLRAEMKESVDPDKLKAAVSLGMKRYPYFRVRAEIQGNEFVNVENGLPIVVKSGMDRMNLLSQESNDHPLGFPVSR